MLSRSGHEGSCTCTWVSTCAIMVWAQELVYMDEHLASKELITTKWNYLSLNLKKYVHVHVCTLHFNSYHFNLKRFSGLNLFEH